MRNYLIAGASALTLLLAGIEAGSAAIDRVVPEPGPAESIQRMTICGRMGKYRLYCGVPDDFVGPLEDPRKQWNRKVP